MAYIGNNPLSVAFLTDQFSGNGSTVAFTLSVAPANTASILVAVTGVVQDPSTYSVSGTTLTFSAAPPSGTGNISVRYLGIPASGVTTTAYRTVTDSTATAGQTTFTIPSYTVGYLNVYRNGVRLAAADFTATSGTTVVLASAATAGDTITTESFYVSSVLNAIPATSGSVAASYLAGGAALSNIGTGGVTQTYLATGVAGTGPAFSVLNNANQSISNNTETKVIFQSEQFDTANCFDSATNYRFTPNVAGYYQFNLTGTIAGSGSITQFMGRLWKNGAAITPRFWDLGVSQGLTNNGFTTATGSALVYMNGSTDYVEVYGYIYGASGTFSGNSGGNCWQFSGSLARAA